MNYFEKAVEDYAKKTKEFYNYKMQRDIFRFNQTVEKMTADGKCPENSQILFLNCRYCPVFLAMETNDNLRFRCDHISPERRREIIAMEVKMTPEEWDEYWSVEKSQNASS